VLFHIGRSQLSNEGLQCTNSVAQKLGTTNITNIGGIPLSIENTVEETI